MHNKLITEYVNLETYPDVERSGHNNLHLQITIGDLHANMIKLIYMLIKHGVIAMEKSDYVSLSSLFKKSTMFAQKLTRGDLEEFDHLLGKIEIKKTDITIRLIGDEMADRVGNDYFTLKVFEKLKKGNVPLEIMLSNHNLAFIKLYEKAQPFCDTLNQGQSASLANMQVLIDNQLVTREEVNRLVKEFYIPQLKAISYSLNAKEDEIAIFSHAPIGLNTLKELADKFKVVFKAGSAKELAETIEGINRAFKQCADDGKIHELYEWDNIARFNNGGYEKNAPIEAITWNKNLKKIDRSETHQGYKLKFIHGHHGYGVSKQPNVDNIDNQLGININHFTGVYSVHCASQDELQLSEERVQYESAQEKLNVSIMLCTESDILNLLIKIKTSIIDSLDKSLEKKAEEINRSLDNDVLKKIVNSLKNHKMWLDLLGIEYEPLKSLLSQLTNQETHLDEKFNKIIAFSNQQGASFKELVKKNNADRVVSHLLNLTNDCLNHIGHGKPAFAILIQLQDILKNDKNDKNDKVDSSKKIKDFYKYLDQDNHFETIKNDNSRATGRFIAGIIAITAIILTLPLGLAVMGAVYAVAKKKDFKVQLPHHLLRPHEKGKELVAVLQEKKKLLEELKVIEEPKNNDSGMINN